MTVKVISVFPANKNVVFENLQKLETLQYIAKPYATFENVGDEDSFIWEASKKFSFIFRLFGVFNLGVHTIRVRRFDEKCIYTNEGNPFCPTWNHMIRIKKLDNQHTLYMDKVEVDAGWKTVFIFIWANLFYRHRQRKWKKLLRQ